MFTITAIASTLNRTTGIRLEAALQGVICGPCLTIAGPVELNMTAVAKFQAQLVDDGWTEQW